MQDTGLFPSKVLRLFESSGVAQQVAVMTPAVGRPHFPDNSIHLLIIEASSAAMAEKIYSAWGKKVSAEAGVVLVCLPGRKILQSELRGEAAPPIEGERDIHAFFKELSDSSNDNNGYGKGGVVGGASLSKLYSTHAHGPGLLVRSQALKQIILTSFHNLIDYQKQPYY